MNAFPDRPPGEATWVPVDACTLTIAEQPVRAAEFDDLFASSLTAVHRIGADRVRLVLSGPEGLRDRAQDLANREARCCSFAGFTLTTSEPGTVLLDIAVPADRIDELARFADRAERHLPPAAEARG